MRRRRLLLVLFTVATAAAGTVWLLRDQPRRRVEQALGDRLGGAVSVSRLHFEGLERVRLENVFFAPGTVGPAPARIAGLVAEGPLGEMTEGRFRSLRVIGLSTRVDVCASDDGSSPQSADGLAAELVEIEDATLELSCGERSASFNASGRALDLGGNLHGELRLFSISPQINLTGDPRSPFLAADELLVTAELGADGGLRASSSATALRLGGPGEVALGNPTLTIDARPDHRGGWQVSAAADAPLLGNLGGNATVLRNPWRVTNVSGHAEGVAADAIAEAVAPIPGVRLGPASLQLTGADLASLVLEATLPELQASLGDLSICAEATINADLGSLTPPPEAGLRARASLSACPGQATAGLVSRLLPAVVTASAGLAGEDTPRLVGEVAVAAPTSGKITSRGWVDLGEAHRFSVDWNWAGVDLPRLLLQLGVATPPEIEIDGRVAASGRLVGNAESAHGRAELDLSGLEIASADDAQQQWTLSAAQAHSVAHWTGNRRIAVTLDQSAVEGRLGVGEPITGQLAASTELRIDGPELAATEIVLELGRLGRVHARSAQGVASWQLDIASDGLDAWPGVLPLVDELLPDGDTVAGSVTADGTLTIGPEDVSLSSRFTLHGGGYASADGGHVIAELAGDGDADLTLNSTGAATASITGHLGGLQLLWGVVYGDYSKHTLDLSSNVRRQADGRWSGTAHADLGKLAATELTIDSDGTATHWRALLHAEDLGAAWQQGLREPCAGSLGALEALDLAHGTLDVVATGEISDTATVNADITLGALDIRNGDAFSLSGLRLELPLALGWRDGQPIAGATRRGSLAFASLELSGLHLPATTSALSVAGDSVTLDSELAIPVLGGRLRFGDLGLEHLLGADRHMVAAVELDSLDLHELSSAFDLPLLEGRLDGHFPRVRLSPDRLRVEGASELQLFGGSLILADIAGRDPLSRYPRIELAMSWDGIDLGQLTRTFDFGRITGIVEGEVEHCELFQGVPVTCAGWLRSTPGPGIEQRISLKAVNNIAIVGTGSGLGILNRGIHRLIDAYPYDSLGFSMNLQNDHFHLRGLARRGDAELFVKGRLPLRLDVVNARPGTTVSFRSMLARLGQLDFATVRTEAGRD